MLGNNDSIGRRFEIRLRRVTNSGGRSSVCIYRMRALAKICLLNISQSSNPLNTNRTSSTTIGQSPQSNLKYSSNAIVIPEHLTQVYEQLDWHGQDLDALLSTTNLTPPQLIGQLMELELLGVIIVQGGRYLRV